MHYRTLRGIDVHYVIRFTSCVEDVALSGVLLAFYFTSLSYLSLVDISRGTSQ